MDRVTKDGLAAVNFGGEWTCQACGWATRVEWRMWGHLVQRHPSDGPGQQFMERLLNSIEQGDFRRD